MQGTLADIFIASVFVSLFLIISRGRRDAHLWLWTFGWIGVWANIVLELWQPTNQSWLQVRECLSVDTLALAGACFFYSANLHRSVNQLAKRFAAALGLMTLVALDLAVFHRISAENLASVVAALQALAILLVLQSRKQRLLFVWLSVMACALVGAQMLAGVIQGHPEAVVRGLLSEIFLIAAIDFCAHGWRYSAALGMMIGGFVAWSAVFPLQNAAPFLWPNLLIDREVWNLPKFCVAVGMILFVLEENTRAARAVDEDYRLIFESNPEPSWITEIETLRICAANQAAAAMHGYTREEFLNLKVTDIVHPDLHDQILAHIASPAPKPRRASRHIRKDGSVFPAEISGHTTVFHGEPCRFVMGIDVSEREMLQQQLDHQAGHDRLTGLPNRALFAELLRKAVEQAIEAEEKLAVVALNIDRFKRVNEMYGLPVGDEYIRRIAGELTARMRSMDIVGRTSGDEFTIVVTGLKSYVSAEQAVNDLAAVFAQPMIVQGYKIQLPVSIGVAVGLDDGTDPAALWRGAESAREEAKAVGGQIVWLSTELRKAAEEKAELESFLRMHSAEDALQLAYQPIYGRDGMVRSFETLLRLGHPRLGIVDPAKLVAIAEATGLIVPLGEWVIEAACRQILIWKSGGVRLVPIAINASGLQLAHIDFAKRLTSTIDRYAIEPRLIHIEITESVAMRNVVGLTEQMAALSARGIVFSIDDFGSGHSSFARLSQLGASILKLDRSFIQPGGIKNAYSIVQAMIDMAHSLGNDVVAEGIESEQQLSSLRELKCDMFQGYLLSPPVSSGEVPQLIDTVHPAFQLTPTAREGLRIVERPGA